MTGGCSPIRGRISGPEPGAERPRITMRVAADEPILAGHYPGLPVFPGVAILEFVRRGALLALSGPAGQWVLTGVGSARFLAPVFPDDVLTAELSWSDDGATPRCVASVASGRGDVARVTMSFALREAA